MKRLLLILLLGRAAAAADVAFTVGKLRAYCKACHAIGELRFIHGEDDGEVWNYLFTGRAPNSGKLWADGIVEVLSWPSDKPPPFDQLMAPPDRDWMPRGSKRLHLAADAENGVPVRRLLIEALSRWAGKPPPPSP
jgi:hypothetical protein